MSKKVARLYITLYSMERFGMSFIFANYVLFLKVKGLNLFEINLVNTAFFVSLFISEIPTGAIADIFGRKISYVIACLLHGISCLFYAGSSTISEFMLAEIIGAVGATCSSGAFQAWLVDSLKYYSSDQPYMPIFARAEQLSVLAGIAGAFAGNYLFTLDTSLPWVMSGGLLLLNAIVAATTMRENYFAAEKIKNSKYWCQFKSTVVCSIKYAQANKVVRFLVLSAAFQLFAVQATNMQWQIRYSDLTGGVLWLAPIFTVISLALALGYSIIKVIAPRVINKKKLISLIQIIIGLAIIGAGLTNMLPASLALFIAHEVARGMYRPVKDAYLNENIVSERRATLISIEAMASHIGGIIGLLASGIIAEYASISAAWIISGSALAVSAILMFKNGNK